MTKDGAVSMNLLDQRLDALDRALLGLVSRNERISMVANIEQRFRDQQSDPALLEILEPLPEVNATSSAVTSREQSRPPRRRSRLALSAGVMGIVAVSLMFLLPITYVVIASIGEAIGEVPAIAMIVLNVGAVAGLGMLGAALSLASIVRLSRSKKQTRGLGWAITGLCTSPVPAILGLLAMVFFVLPITLEYANQSSHTAQAGDFAVPTTPTSHSAPSSHTAPAECGPNGCTIPPALSTTPYATESLPALSPPIPTSPNQAYAPSSEARVANLAPWPDAPPATKPVAAKDATAPLSSGSEPKADTPAPQMYLPPLESADSLP